MGHTPNELNVHVLIGLDEFLINCDVAKYVNLNSEECETYASEHDGTFELVQSTEYYLGKSVRVFYFCFVKFYINFVKKWLLFCGGTLFFVEKQNDFFFLEKYVVPFL